MIGHMTVPWARARRIAARAAAPRPAVVVPLADAVGLILAEPITARTPLPPFDVATGDGWAISGPGPWTVEAATGGRLPDGAATAVQVDTALPAGADAVVPRHHGVVRTGKGTTWLYVGDATTGRQSERPGHIPAGTGISALGSAAGSGDHLALAGRLVTPAVVAAAATAGHDALAVVRPPDVVTLTMGDARWDRGRAHDGRMRDPVTPLLPGAVTRAGGRCLPAHQVPGTAGTLADAVRALLDDVAADLILLTGAPGGLGRADAAGALSGLGGTPLLADVAVAPGSDALLAEAWPTAGSSRTSRATRPARWRAWSPSSFRCCARWVAVRSQPGSRPARLGAARVTGHDDAGAGKPATRGS